MRFRNSRLRIKVTALLVSLTALWAFAAWVTLREGVNLLWVATLDKHIAQPTDPLLADLQRERRLSVVQLANPGAQQEAALRAQRGRTDRAVTNVIRLARDGSVKRAAGRSLERRIDETLTLLDGLNATRNQLDSGGADRGRTVEEYSTIIESIFRIYDSLATLDDKQFAKDTAALLELNRMWEVLSQEDAILAGALATGRLSIAERTRFTEIVGARRFNTDRVALKIQQYDPAAYTQLTKSAPLSRVEALEDAVIQRIVTPRRGPAETRPGVTAQQWADTTGPAIAQLRQIIQASGDRLIERAKPIATGAIVRLLLAGGLGLLAVIASIIVSITTARALVAQLDRLRHAALELAERRLPSVVERLGRGEEVDVATEAPPLAFGSDAVGQVSRAFNAVQETAIRSAVEQAELRRGIRDVLLSLARRTQTLVHRQLTLLDRMERREMETAELEDLFRLDHLATRMRRNAENLIVLSGATPARGWRRSVPMMDVVRAAVAEIEDYTRVSVLPMGSVSLAGRAVGDITHLLAELIENAVSFSPPPAVVQVSAHVTARGYAIEIEDRGLGIAEERLEAINARISDPPEFNMSRSVQLGLYVVGRLAQRYGVRVTLKNSAYGGTTAVVLIPGDLLIDDPDGAADAPVPVSSPARAAAEPVAVAAVSTRRRAALGGGRQRAPVLVGNSAEPAEPDEPAEPAEPDDADMTRGLPRRERKHSPPPSVGTRPPGPSAKARPDATAEAQETQPEGPGNTMPLTPAGLPFRIPQASINPALRSDRPAGTRADETRAGGDRAAPAASGAGRAADDARRSPEEVRRLVGSYLSGTNRGRSDAARARRAPADPAAATPPRAADESPE
ncbi:MAG TPA: nitrate- and nitrite sensing domain-containing protein [Streptosporangiaceae bacterium]|nr:nitrate- and nitrite sensing domain-containing protein [Streptosporangiaceae bacterium]